MFGIHIYQDTLLKNTKIPAYTYQIVVYMQTTFFFPLLKFCSDKLPVYVYREKERWQRAVHAAAIQQFAQFVQLPQIAAHSAIVAGAFLCYNNNNNNTIITVINELSKSIKFSK
jgi:hypothetical protein